jgi:hypothetical protein
MSPLSWIDWFHYCGSELLKIGKVWSPFLSLSCPSMPFYFLLLDDSVGSLVLDVGLLKLDFLDYSTIRNSYLARGGCTTSLLRGLGRKIQSRMVWIGMSWVHISKITTAKRPRGCGSSGRASALQNPSTSKTIKTKKERTKPMSIKDYPIADILA